MTELEKLHYGLLVEKVNQLENRLAKLENKDNAHKDFRPCSFNHHHHGSICCYSNPCTWC